MRKQKLITIIIFFAVLILLAALVVVWMSPAKSDPQNEQHVELDNDKVVLDQPKNEDSPNQGIIIKPSLKPEDYIENFDPASLYNEDGELRKGYVCTADLKTCPNGITVGRVHENHCEFAPCPLEE